MLLHGLLLFAPWGAWCGTEPPNRLLSLPPLLAGRAELAEVCFMAGVWLIPSPVLLLMSSFFSVIPETVGSLQTLEFGTCTHGKGCHNSSAPGQRQQQLHLVSCGRICWKAFFFSGLLLLLLVYQREKLWRDLSLCLLCPWPVCVCVCVQALQLSTRHTSSFGARREVGAPQRGGKLSKWEL